MQLTPAQIAACRAFTQANAIIAEWIRGMGGWAALPEKFDISGEGWIQAETAIEQAAGDGDVARVRELGDAYIGRVTAYCKRWEAIMNKSKEAA